MAGKNGSASFASRRMCGLVGVAGVAGVASLTSRPVCKESYKKAALEKNKGWYSGSSSSGGEERRPSDQEEELEKLRANLELLKKQQRWGKGLETQGEANEKRRWSGRGLQNGC